MDFILNNKNYFLLIEQYSNSPLIEKLCLEQSIGFFKPLYEFVERGKKQHLFKEVETALLLTYCHFPIVQLAKEHFKGKFLLNEERLQDVIKMSWDAVKA
jgi:hypothetical protein